MTLTKDTLIEMIRDKVGFPVKEAKDILETVLEEIKQKLEEGREVKISGFGKWTVKEKRSRAGPKSAHRTEDRDYGPSRGDVPSVRQAARIRESPGTCDRHGKFWRRRVRISRVASDPIERPPRLNKSWMAAFLVSGG